MRDFSDQQWDYGLETGESFEPSMRPDESIDLSHPHVMTVLGPVDPEALGFTLHHEHLICRPPGADLDRDLALDDVSKAVSELEGYSATGGRAIVDMTTAANGRNAGDLLWIAAPVPVHIVAATGAQRISEPTARESVEALAQVMIDELTSGIDGTPARAGVISATGDEPVLRAAAVAHGSTGATISINAGSGADMLCGFARLIEAGVPPASVVAWFEGSSLDQRRPRELLELGSFVSVLNWPGLAPGSVDPRAGLIAALVDDGFGDQILISGGIARKSNWLSYGGGPGFAGFLDLLPLQLMDAGISALNIRRLFIENPARALTIKS